jgi:hypothetical protein
MENLTLIREAAALGESLSDGIRAYGNDVSMPGLMREQCNMEASKVSCDTRLDSCKIESRISPRVQEVNNYRKGQSWRRWLSDIVMAS